MSPSASSGLSRSALLVATLALATGGAVAAPASPAAAAAVLPTVSDFDKDGTEDVAAEARDQSTGLSKIVVRYGGTRAPAVVTPPGGWQASPLMLDETLAPGDFNGDGYDDLAAADAGAAGDESGGVWVFWGSSQGLSGSTSLPPRFFDQNSAGVPGVPEPGDYFGSALAAGDLNGDGRTDLAIGARGEDAGSTQETGSVTVMFGAPTGFAATSKVYSQDTTYVPGVAEAGDEFGAALAVGDVTGDGRLDLAVSAIGENAVGMLHLLPGSSTGPTGTGSSGLTASALGISGTLQYFGASLAIGDVNGDKRGEVVAGAAFGQLRSTSRACGFLAVVRGAATLSSTGSRLIDQDTAGVPGGCEEFDSFGWRVAAGDLTGDGRADLVVSAPGEAIGSLTDAGAYTVLLGSATGVTTTGSFGISQDSPNVPGATEAKDVFGQSIQVRDVNHDRRADVVIGAPSENSGAGFPGDGYVGLLLSGTGGRPAAGSGAYGPAILGTATSGLISLGLSIG